MMQEGPKSLVPVRHYLVFGFFTASFLEFKDLLLVGI